MEQIIGGTSEIGGESEIIVEEVKQVDWVGQKCEN